MSQAVQTFPMLSHQQGGIKDPSNPFLSPSSRYVGKIKNTGHTTILPSTPHLCPAHRWNPALFWYISRHFETNLVRPVDSVVQYLSLTFAFQLFSCSYYFSGFPLPFSLNLIFHKPHIPLSLCTKSKCVTFQLFQRRGFIFLDTRIFEPDQSNNIQF